MKSNHWIIAALLSIVSVTYAEKAPDFSLTDTNGTQHKLAQYQGKIVVLEWLNHNCPFVKKHYNSGNMQQLQKSYTAKGVVWLSICSSAVGKQGHYSPEAANKLTSQKAAAPTAVLMDAEGTVGKAYKAKRTPEMVIINQAGELVYHGAIDDSPGFDENEVKGAKNYVAQNLDALLAGKKIPIKNNKPYGCGIKYQR